MDYRDKCKLFAPDKTFAKDSLKWNLNETSDGNLFNVSARQEVDVYDTDLLKYMRKQERGIFKPAGGKDKVMTNLEKTKDQLKEELVRSTSYKTRYTATNSLKWDPNNFMPTLLHDTAPLNDVTLTPRGQKRAITLERCFDKQPWMYNRTQSAHFSGLG